MESTHQSSFQNMGYSSQETIKSNQTNIPVTVDMLYQNIHQLISSVDNHKNYPSQIPQNNLEEIPYTNTFDEDPSQLKLKVRTLEIEVVVQKDMIVRLESEKLRLQLDLDDLRAEMGLNNHINISFNKSGQFATNQQEMLMSENQRLKNQIENLKLNQNEIKVSSVKELQYETTIKNLTIQIQRVMNINDQRANVQYTNQVLRAEINKFSQINRILGQENMIIKQTLNNYHQERVQLYQNLEIMKDLENRNNLLQASCQKLQIQVNRYRAAEDNSKRDDLVSRRNQTAKSKQRDYIKSIVMTNRRQASPSPLDDLPDGIRYKPYTQMTPKNVKQNLSTSKMISPKANNRSSKVSLEHSNWNKLQERINALKSQNQELKKSIFTR